MDESPVPASLEQGVQVSHLSLLSLTHIFSVQDFMLPGMGTTFPQDSLSNYSPALPERVGSIWVQIRY